MENNEENSVTTLQCDHCHAPLPIIRDRFIRHYLGDASSGCSAYLRGKFNSTSLARCAASEFNERLASEINQREDGDEQKFFMQLAQACSVNDTLRLQELIARQIMNEEAIISTNDKDMYYYQNGLYLDGADSRIQELVQNYLSNSGLMKQATKQKASEVVGHIFRSTLSRREDLEVPLNLICLNNGVFNLDTGILQPHSSDYFFISRLPVDYKPSAKCLKFEKFLSEVVADRDCAAIQELFGYCLYRRYNIHKAFMLIGEGANGKSTLLNVLGAILGKENCSHIPLQQLSEDKFAQAYLYGKFANLFADIDSNDIGSSGMFKLLVGEDRITADRKFKGMINFKNYAKLIFSCNKLPRTKDDSNAFFRRWIIISFLNKFEGADQDVNLSDKLTNPDELSGILNFALAGLKRLQQQGYFTGAKETDEIRSQYIRLSDPIKSFIIDMLYTAAEADVEKGRLYAEYCSYCTSKSCPAESHNKFSRRLKEEIYNLRDYFKSIGERQVECWKGVRIKDKGEYSQASSLNINNNTSISEYK